MDKKNEPLRWETLSSEYLFREPWFTVRRDHVRLPGGSEIPSFYVLEYPDWVNTIAITREGRFIMIEQYRYGMDGVETELCAGVCEPGEKPLAAAQRELMEETGYGGGEWEELMIISPNPSTIRNTTHCFLARGVEKTGSQSLDQTEQLRVRVMDETEVVSLLNDNKIRQSLMAAPLWKYMALRKG